MLLYSCLKYRIGKCAALFQFILLKNEATSEPNRVYIPVEKDLKLQLESIPLMDVNPVDLNNKSVGQHDQYDKQTGNNPSVCM